jgi:hypothetical protein
MSPFCALIVISIIFITELPRNVPVVTVTRSIMLVFSPGRRVLPAMQLLPGYLQLFPVFIPSPGTMVEITALVEIATHPH